MNALQKFVLKTKAAETTSLHVTPKHRLLVFVWRTKKQMLIYANALPHDKRFGYETEAFCHIPRAKIGVGPRGKITILTKVVGQIHLVRGRFGAGVFAHELQHFLSYWYADNNWDITGKHFEKAAYLAGDLTTEFWTWFYKLKGDK